MITQFNSISYIPSLLADDNQKSNIRRFCEYISQIISKPDAAISSVNVIETNHLSKNFNFSPYLNYQVVHLAGELDLFNTTRLRDVLFLLLKQGCPLLIDFTHLSFIDCSAIAVLQESLNFAKSSGLSLSIIGANGSPLQLLELTHLSSVFNLLNRFEDVKLFNPLNNLHQSLKN